MTRSPTRSPLPPPLARRATAAGRLLRRARRDLEGGGPLAPGFAVLEMRDAIGMLLRVVADHQDGDAEGGETTLSQLAARIGSAHGQSLTHGPALEELDSAAARFLADAEGPDRQAVRRLLHDLESFFAETVRTVLDTDPDRLAAHRLLAHRRTENWLRRSQEALREDRPEEAITAAAAALAIFLRHHSRDGIGGAGAANDGTSTATGPAIEALATELRAQTQRLDFLAAGVDLSAYRRFRTLTPEIEFAADGEVRPVGTSDEASDPARREDAEFCHAFALDTLLALRESRAESPSGEKAGRRTNVVLRATSATPLLVSPSPDGERIRRVSAGEVLKTHRAGEPRDGFLPIVVDGDPAWVAQDAVEEIG